MKVDTARKIILSSLLALPFYSFAGTPTSAGVAVGFESLYTVTNGDVGTYTCPAGWTCGATPIIGDGFYQRSVTDDLGNSFFHTVLLGGAGQAAGESFVSESFVTVGAADGGIATFQRTDDLTSSANGTLQSSATILSGNMFFNPATENNVDLSQVVTDATDGTPANGEFNASFDFTSTLMDVSNGGGLNDVVGTVSIGQSIQPSDLSFQDSFQYQEVRNTIYDVTGTLVGSADGVTVGKKVDIDTQINLGSALTDQVFQYDYRDGILTPATVAGDATFADGTVIDWVANDEIERVLLTQGVNGAGDFGFGRLSDLSINPDIAGDNGGTASDSYEVFDLTGNISAGITYDLVDPFQ